MEAAGGPEHSTSSVTFNLIGYTPRRNKYCHEFRCQGAAPNACRHRQGPSYTKVARNLTRSVLKNVSKRCNPNDVNSMFEIVAGELRAKLGTVSARRQVRSGRDTCAVATGPGRASRRRAEPKARSADDSRAGRRPPAHTAAGPDGARNTRGTTSTVQKVRTPRSTPGSGRPGGRRGGRAR